MTERKIWDEINAVATLPGVTPGSPLQPIEGRVVMLQSGIKASMAVRIYGDSLEGLAKASLAVAEHLKAHHLVNAGTVNPDIVMGKPYFEFEVDREEAARYGMTTHDGQPDRRGGTGRRRCDRPPSKAANAIRSRSAINATCANDSTNCGRCPSSRTPAKSCRWSGWPR